MCLCERETYNFHCIAWLCDSILLDVAKQTKKNVYYYSAEEQHKEKNIWYLHVWSTSVQASDDEAKRIYILGGGGG